MRKQACFLFLLSLLLSTGISHAQDSNRLCSDSPLTGLTKLFIDAGDDLESRNQIIDVIGKEFPALTIVEQKEQAEILITYSHRVERRETDGIIGRSALLIIPAMPLAAPLNGAFGIISSAQC